MCIEHTILASSVLQESACPMPISSKARCCCRVSPLLTTHPASSHSNLLLRLSLLRPTTPQLRYLGILLRLLAQLDSARPRNSLMPQISSVATLRGASNNALVCPRPSGVGTEGSDVLRGGRLVDFGAFLCGDYEAVGRVGGGVWALN